VTPCPSGAVVSSPALLGLCALAGWLRGPLIAEGQVPTGRWEQDIQRAQAAYRLEATAPGRWPEADIFLLPDGGTVELEAELTQTDSLPPRLRERSRQVHWRAEAGQILDHRPQGRLWRARWTPPVGSAAVRVEAVATITLEGAGGPLPAAPLLVSHRAGFSFLPPISRLYLLDGKLDDYAIGDYLDPRDPTLGQRFNLESRWHELYPERYRPPDYFYRVDATTKGLRISPHLTLGHFAIDFPWGSLGLPQYVAVDPALVEKLEALVALMREDGRFGVTGLTPIYGFRPPAFNLKTIEDHAESNLKVPFSMHQYGRAMDFIIDEDGDLVLDDLNGDGRHDILDTLEILHYVNLLDRRYREAGQWDRVGGAGIYDHHDFTGRPQTAYIHVDTRGFQNEQGELIRWRVGWPEHLPFPRWGSI